MPTTNTVTEKSYPDHWEVHANSTSHSSVSIQNQSETMTVRIHISGEDSPPGSDDIGFLLYPREHLPFEGFEGVVRSKIHKVELGPFSETSEADAVVQLGVIRT